MKPINLILLAAVLSYSGISKAIDYKTVNRIELAKYEEAQLTNKVVIPVNFAEAFLISKAALSEINVNEVYQIDLVYTQYKESANFDQEALNKQRIKQLEKRIPNINIDQPNWNFVAQTKAKDRATANSYFHGFVIYYRKEAPSYADQKDHFKNYRTEITTTYTLNNTESADLAYHSGSQIHVPANAVTYANGKPVEGDYTIEYTEYRTSADIAFSGIPMKFAAADGNMSFSSIGMYEIRGFQNEQELALQKPITVDFNCTKKVADASFYELDEATEEWKVIAPISFSDFGDTTNEVPITQNNEAESDNVTPIFTATESRGKIGLEALGMNGMNIFKAKSISDDMSIKYDWANDGTVSLKLNKKAWESFEKLIGELSIDTLFTEFDKKKRKITTIESNRLTLQTSIFNEKYTLIKPITPKVWTGGKNGNGTVNPWTANSNLVSGLRTKGFGVYNCDQVRRIANKRTIYPIYTDAATDAQLVDCYVACLLDLDYTNSFSFNPSNITFNNKGRNALLLTTGDSRSYLVLPNSFAKAVALSSANPNFEMIDITDQVKSSNDLYALLKNG